MSDMASVMTGTISPSVAAATLNNLTNADTVPLDSGPILVSAPTWENGMTDYQYEVGTGLVPANYNFTDGLSGNIDGVSDFENANTPALGINPTGTDANPGNGASSYLPGQVQGVFQSFASLLAPKPTPLLNPSGSAIIPNAQPASFFNRTVAGGLTGGQIVIGIIAALALIAVVQSAKR